MKAKQITITREYKKSGNYNSISGSVSLTYDVGSEIVSKAFETGRIEVDSLLKLHFEQQDDWMNKLIDKPAKADIEGYK